MLEFGPYRPKPVVLCILDGWGYAEPGPNNAIDQAKTPNYDRWWETYARAFLDTSGEQVGLPAGQMGNSEVGHMNIGGGRVVLQDLPRIDDAIKTGALVKNKALMDMLPPLRKTGGALHLMGLLSPGGVHSHQDHMVEVAKLFSGAGTQVHVHAFLDGRDTPPKSAAEFIAEFEKPFEEDPNVKIATVSGRYYAMDRDKRWERVEKAFDALSEGKGLKADSAWQAISEAYSRGETDEFVMPTVIGPYRGMIKGDALLMINFRADRAREILTTLVDPDFTGFVRPRLVDFSAKAGMVEYSDDLNQYLEALFPPVEVNDSLGEVVSKAGMSQLRIAETEKYAHVTFFFNGGREKAFPGEDRVLIPSPKVATYDLQPEMSAKEVVDRVFEEIVESDYDLIVVNFANPDMVGHTGKLGAAIKAVETIDYCLGRMEKALKQKSGVMLMSADHGNVEQMQDPGTKAPHTAHTTFKVPVILVDPRRVLGKKISLRNGKLADLAPTVLELLDLPQPDAMTGCPLIVSAKAKKNVAPETV